MDVQHPRSHFTITKYNTEVDATAATNIVQLPLTFVRSGYIGLNDGTLYYVGGNLFSRSRTAYSDNDSYNLRFNVDTISPTYHNYRYYGFLLRCLYLDNRLINQTDEKKRTVPAVSIIQFTTN